MKRRKEEMGGSAFGYSYEEEAKNHIKDTSRYGTSANIPVLAVAYTQLALVEVGRQIASTLEDISGTLRDLIKILEKNKKEE